MARGRAEYSFCESVFDSPLPVGCGISSASTIGKSPIAPPFLGLLSVSPISSIELGH